MKGRELKQLIEKHIQDEDIVCIGEKNDNLGRYDKKIIGIETRKVGFDEDITYKAIITKSYESNGTMKFWK